jgi:hypothetical protein
MVDIDRPFGLRLILLVSYLWMRLYIILKKLACAVFVLLCS